MFAAGRLHNGIHDIKGPRTAVDRSCRRRGKLRSRRRGSALSLQSKQTRFTSHFSSVEIHNRLEIRKKYIYRQDRSLKDDLYGMQKNNLSEVRKWSINTFSKRSNASVEESNLNADFTHRRRPSCTRNWEANNRMRRLSRDKQKRKNGRTLYQQSWQETTCRTANKNYRLLKLFKWPVNVKRRYLVAWNTREANENRIRDFICVISTGCLEFGIIFFLIYFPSITSVIFHSLEFKTILSMLQIVSMLNLKHVEKLFR